MVRIVRTLSNLHKILMPRCGDVIRISILGAGGCRWSRLVKARNLCSDLPNMSISQKMLFQHMAQQCLLRETPHFHRVLEGFTRFSQFRLVNLSCRFL